MAGFLIGLSILNILQVFEYAGVLNLLQYSYINIVIIIIVTNVIMLEFLSAWFVHPGSAQLTILSFFNTSYGNYSN